VIIGIDPSLRSTGLALLSVAGETQSWGVTTIRSSAPTGAPNAELAQFRRMKRIVGDIQETIFLSVELGQTPHLAVIEGPAYSKNEGMAHERAGLWWFVYELMVGMRVPICVVRPNLRAKYATGNGTSGKDEVMLAASRRYAAVPITNNNEADAVVLAAMGARLRGCPIDKLPKTHIEALKTLPTAQVGPIQLDRRVLGR
jgi:crossover junction endodeoxyribonuclease RuvC